MAQNANVCWLSNSLTFVVARSILGKSILGIEQRNGPDHTGDRAGSLVFATFSLVTAVGTKIGKRAQSSSCFACMNLGIVRFETLSVLTANTYATSRVYI